MKRRKSACECGVGMGKGWKKQRDRSYNTHPQEVSWGMWRGKVDNKSRLFYEKLALLFNELSCGGLKWTEKEWVNDKAYKWTLKSNTIVKFWKKKKVYDEVCR